MDSRQRQQFTELVHCLAVEPGAEATCRVCGESYVPMDALHFVCTECYLRLRRVADFKTLVLLVGLRALARGATATAERST